MIAINSIPYNLQGGVSISEGSIDQASSILSADALKFIATLEREFGERRKALLRRRQEHQQELNTGKMPGFLHETKHIRSSYWKSAPIPAALNDRRVESVGAPDAKTIIDALNSEANVFVADFEDSCSPTWNNILQGHINIYNAVRGSLHYTDGEGTLKTASGSPVKLMICPRGLHAEEKHIMVDRKPVSASLFDFGLYFFHNVHDLVAQEKHPYVYVPKIENHYEAKFWNDVFLMAQDEYRLPHNTIKATVIIETLCAAFEMNEILYELREHCVALNCGWNNYIFSFIKKLRYHHDFVIPDQSRLTTSSHFLRSLSMLLIQTCHKRGVHAIAGLLFEKPVTLHEKEQEAMVIKTRVEKESHAEEGFDGTSVIYPYAVAIAKAAFSESAYQPNQLPRKRDDVQITSGDLLTIHRGEVTELGVSSNIIITLEYLAAWLSGSGVTIRKEAIINAAVVEVARTQLWQWMHNQRSKYLEGQKLTEEYYRKVVNEELKRLLSFEKRKESVPYYTTAKIILDLLLLDTNFTEFFSLPAYEHIE